MWASTTDDNAVYEQSDKRMCQLINTRGTSINTNIGRIHRHLFRLLSFSPRSAILSDIPLQIPIFRSDIII